MKPYQAIPICDRSEPLVPIPRDRFPLVEPHAYQSLGAPYGNQSPYSLRAGVLAALTEAQDQLQRQHSGWHIQIFDAFRPLAVQRFMVEHTFTEQVQARGWITEALTPAQRDEVMAEVAQFWAMPSNDPATPPPHSTGAALDVTLIDAAGSVVDMGSPIDEVSPRSHPDHFADRTTPVEQTFHAHRTLLNQAMESAGFRRHPNEWWHFSLGDQLWAWLRRQETGSDKFLAHYGRASVDLWVQ
ncbi:MULTISPECIES: M15 family metallopeptidase [Cyanophyceae]|uniref:D-alanyl-D-alanine dipeptidase n=1 Tax=Leptolyngbya subtilissima DQ-A4 TaxID=2933933 RepID=A0ABV0K032_9CYAN|nr:M15 family metallopeptidase [Nodosilinea sp. FACHB-141]MBD2111965.1 D-alanyl-D-alanine dipeptidase [Nodosilinea sp. FACHB-141]